LKIKRLEELKNNEELQKVLEITAAKLKETRQSQIDSERKKQQYQQQQKAQLQQPSTTINNSKQVLTENQIQAKSILLSKHNLLKTTNEVCREQEDKFLTNILEKYTSLRNKLDSEAKISKTSMESSSSSSIGAMTRSNSFKRITDSTYNRNKILDIYLIKSQLRIGDNFKIADKISNGRTKSAADNLLPLPMTTSNLVENLNTNRNLYVANSRPLLIKRNLELTNGENNTTMPLSFSKINMEKIKMIEKKNNELLLNKESENYKLCLN